VAIGLAEALPHIQVTIAELPAVAKFTRRFVERAGAAERVQVQAVDIVRQPLTGTFDAAILRYILHVMSLEDACRVLLNVHQALKPGGTIYIQGGPLDDSRLTPQYQVMWGSGFHSDIRAWPESHSAGVSGHNYKSRVWGF
jgi:hypothetical protein